MRDTYKKLIDEHSANCRIVRDLLGQHPSRNLLQLHWYGMPLSAAVSESGILAVASWLSESVQIDEISDNHGMKNLFFAPPMGDGINQSGATVWNCQSIDSRPWHGPSSTIERLESAFDHIRAEFLNVLDSRSVHPDNVSLVSSGRWDGLVFHGAGGSVNFDLQSRCSSTSSLLASLGVNKAFGFAMFSVLSPKTKILPHCGSSNLRLRHHLALVAPEPDLVRLRVGSTWKSWEEGKAFAFEDAFEHEVVHEGVRDRAVLIVDTWHPSLTAAEIEVLQHPVFQKFGRVAKGQW